MIKTIFLLIILLSPQAYGSDDLAIKLMEVARNNITSARVKDGSFVPPETVEEKRYPIIPIEDARRVIAAGQKSGIAAWCKVEWEESSFQKLMKYERSKNKWTQKQLAYIGLLHGVTMGIFEKGAKDQNGECSKEQANKISENLRKMMF